ncbi:Long-chain-fatty-acid--CoA ligase [Enhygromyxa salina]|uniref:Long-chain-fatty-acid--CoA ligase n=1 Tax=Enhygromyxa salina TaxID=215803 RepID=A0A2S9YIC5_9BACT|nr:long-chain-acyl-CoA synthetase [Enhygromyxa salina]PRQ04766.1 Long-chain-fatty-acid--CoA ligase [Enhygromyxa salina]
MTDSSQTLSALLRQSATRARAVLRGLRTNFFWDPSSCDNIPRELQRWAAERPNDPFLSFEGRQWTVGSFDAEVNRHARAWRELDCDPGQVVALVMENRPAFLFHFYALGKLGVVASLINPALRGPALRHALEVCEPTAILVDARQLEALRELGHDALPVGPDRVFVDVEAPRGQAEPGHAFEPFQSWNPRVCGALPLALAGAELNGLDEVAAYVYTSGTTGLPKPAVVKHHRLRRAGDVFAGLARMTPDDCVYCCLPLYHASATAVAVPMVIASRARLALARKFSASRFWTECRSEGATVCMYIGELCRYLYNTPPGPDDGRHQVRCFVGNGLRPDIWDGFCERFGVEQVVEFYAATEGNAETANLFNRSGTVGPMLPWKMALARWDVERGEILRDASGFAVKAGVGEPGVLLGKIDARNPYAGYTDEGATKRKILTDVFEPGDAWFDSGDLLARDRLWHLHFVDRLGDTFRWKGENVSTQEVAELLNQGPGVRESNVYGVEIPGTDGRVGMAAMVVEPGFAPERLYAYVDAELPRYAAPRFLRLVDSLSTTGTFKHRKVELRDEGWDLERVRDPLLLRDAKGRSYVELTPERAEAVRNGQWPV